MQGSQTSTLRSSKSAVKAGSYTQPHEPLTEEAGLIQPPGLDRDTERTLPCRIHGRIKCSIYVGAFSVS